MTRKETRRVAALSADTQVQRRRSKRLAVARRQAQLRTRERHRYPRRSEGAAQGLPKSPPAIERGASTLCSVTQGCRCSF
ncbi:unnamed protein product [Peniophora sp. CBMAI 1063]|nr:unnamed protein product [Peniophora sp. CBMAI 1063]